MATETTKTTDTTSLDPISAIFVSFITTFLDDFGAWEWSYWIVAIVTGLILYVIKTGIGKVGGVDWYSLLHSIITGLGAMVCVYLNFMAAEPLTGITEPLRTAQCEAPLTSLHRILPAITMGYSILDIVDGVTAGLDFLMHGLATLSVMVFFCAHNKPHLVSPMLIMEFSTIFLALVRIKGISGFWTASVLGAFTLSFFWCRILVFPYIWSELVQIMQQESSSQLYQSCFPGYFKYVVFGFGMFYNCLNLFWFYKILRKAARKLGGAEKVQELNDVMDKASRTDKKTR